VKKDNKVHEYYGFSVFGKYGLAGLGILFAISILFQWKELILVLVSCLVIFVVARLWAGWSLYRFKISESISNREVFPEEDISIEIHLQNEKLLPMPWVHLVTEGIQRYITKEELDLSILDDDQDRKLSDNIYKVGWISGREKVLLRHITKLPRRGIYKVSTSKAVSGDPFSLFLSERTFKGFTEVIVYPRILDFTWPEFGIKSPNGNISDNNFVFTDPAHRIGLRDYQPSDPLKSINWVASARFQTLKANLYEGKSVAKCLIFLDGGSLKKTEWDKEKRDLAWELLLSGIASFSLNLSTSDKEWEFITDVIDKAQKHHGRQSDINSTSQSHKIRQLLVKLARTDINYPLTDPLNLFMRTSIRSGYTLFIFSSEYNPDLESSIQKLGKFKQIKWFVLEEHANDGEETIPLRPGWDKDLLLKQQLCG
jgi:hypothetical protein